MEPIAPTPAKGIAGRLAHFAIGSKLTPLLIISSLLAGAFALLWLPREEEPQIIVPMIDVFVRFPGAAPKDVEERVTKPMEKLLWEIPGVEYVYSTSSPGQSMVIVRFKVGEDEERSLVRLNQKLSANFDLIPPGASMPLVKPRSIDDVPILALTLHSKRYNDLTLRSIAAQAHDAIKQVADVSEVRILGGQRRQLKVTLDVARLRGYGLSPTQIIGALQRSNTVTPAGAFNSGNQQILMEAGDFLQGPEDAGRVVVQAVNGRPVYLRDVADITDGGEEPVQYVEHGTRNGFEAAVTLSISKRKSTNAIDVAHRVLQRVSRLKGNVLPSDVDVAITRNYGETAAEKSNELLFHMGIAVVSVSILIAWMLGRRESLIVFIAIPVTLALTLTVFYLYGYTLNRITLFALIFSIGILVDDAIVIVENIVRHARMKSNQNRSMTDVAVEAVDEVGNPTILATLTVIAAILPMAFVGGLMGPYMRPIPIGASSAMVFSLLIAFLVTPWAAVRLLKRNGGSHADGEHEDRATHFYRRAMGRLIHERPLRYGFLGGVVVLLLGAMALVYVQFVQVKMLPFDNKSEFQVIIDMPEGTTLETTAQVAHELAQATLQTPEVVHVQSYTGTASPYNFNGLVRHYYLRQGANVADLQVNLRSKDERSRPSHEIAKAVRTRLQPIAERYQARIKVAEVPPGPPVLQTLVAEVYGPDATGRQAIAQKILRLFETTPGVVDADWYVEAPQKRIRWRFDQQKAALAGISEAQLGQTLSAATEGATAGLLHDPHAKEDVPLMVRLDRASRSDVHRLLELPISTPSGQTIALGELATPVEETVEPSIYHKNLMPVTYVTADVAGTMESPVYAILKLGPQIEKIRQGSQVSLEQFTAHQPLSDEHYAMKWDGEWHITYEVFRDLGIAFAAVLILIYILVVGWFQSFSTPLVIMAAIPFSLVGILPAHGMLGAFFTATSMIGFIAGAGIVVRNSIILVDFVELRLNEGMALDQAVIDAGAVRFRPMLLTAAAVVVGSAVILFDPIFQGLAVALMAGEIASLLLSRVTVPIVYFMVHDKRGKA